MSEEQKSHPQLPPVVMQYQYIKDLSLEIPFAPEIFAEMSGEPKIDISVDINAKHMGENLFEVDLSFRIEGSLPDKKLFVLEMVYGATARLNVSEEHIEPVLMIEIPHLVFPYARQAISNAMANSGLPPLMLAPIDFVGMYQARQARAASEQKQ